MNDISYTHSEAYAAGELKYGAISLIEEGILDIGVLTQKELFEKTFANLVETKRRDSYLATVTNYVTTISGIRPTFPSICPPMTSTP